MAIPFENSAHLGGPPVQRDGDSRTRLKDGASPDSDLVPLGVLRVANPAAMDAYLKSIGNMQPGASGPVLNRFPNLLFNDHPLPDIMGTVTPLGEAESSTNGTTNGVSEHVPTDHPHGKDVLPSAQTANGSHQDADYAAENARSLRELLHLPANATDSELTARIKANNDEAVRHGLGLPLDASQADVDTLMRVESGRSLRSLLDLPSDATTAELNDRIKSNNALSLRQSLHLAPTATEGEVSAALKKMESNLP